MNYTEKVYEKITNKFVDAIQFQGKMPWQKPWVGGTMPRNYATKRTYNGINLVLTLFSGFDSPNWLTFNQVNQLGGLVKKGSKGTPIIFWEKRESLTGEKNSQGEDVKKSYLLLKDYVIFNEEQIEGIDFKNEVVLINEEERMLEIENIFKATNIQVLEGGDSACYIPMQDLIKMPKFGFFKSKNDYYATLSHEFIHATGHVSRLKREGVANFNRFGSEQYSFEELVAEIGSCMFLSLHGIQNDKVESNQMAYVQNWIRVLKNDPSMIIKASKEAQKAVDWIVSKSKEVEKA